MSIPSIRKIGRSLGDMSALGSPAGAQRRFWNRMIGRGAGKAVGGAQARFGVWGLIATAEFFYFLKLAMAARFAGTEIWFGSMANYAIYVERGWTHHITGDKYPPRPYFYPAIRQAEAERSAFKGGFNYRLGALTNPSSSPGTKIRSGVYEGQKFLGDLGQFAKDAGFRGLTGRYVRREAGRQVSGTLFGAMQNRRNPLELYVQRVIINARKNLEPISATGVLRASIAMGETEAEFIWASINQIKAHGSARGLPDAEINRRIGRMTKSGSVRMRGPDIIKKFGGD